MRSYFTHINCAKIISIYGLSSVPMECKNGCHFLSPRNIELRSVEGCSLTLFFHLRFQAYNIRSHICAINACLQIEAEKQTSCILGAEHAILETLFPRHVIEHMAVVKAQSMSISEESTACQSKRASPSKVSFSSSQSESAAVGNLATAHEQVTIMFADIVGFTSMCKRVSPARVMSFLNELYSAFDDLVEIYRVYKVSVAHQ